MPISNLRLFFIAAVLARVNNIKKKLLSTSVEHSETKWRTFRAPWWRVLHSKHVLGTAEFHQIDIKKRSKKDEKVRRSMHGKMKGEQGKGILVERKRYPSASSMRDCEEKWRVIVEFFGITCSWFQTTWYGKKTRFQRSFWASLGINIKFGFMFFTYELKAWLFIFV